LLQRRLPGKCTAQLLPASPAIVAFPSWICPERGGYNENVAPPTRKGAEKGAGRERYAAAGFAGWIFH
jgi:hypothetical protein